MNEIPWSSTTHKWSGGVDLDHLAAIRAKRSILAPTGVSHLIMEVVAYAAEEAEANPSVAGMCRVVLFADGSIEVSDNGRGTQTRLDAAGRAVKKPVMSTKDLRYFDSTCSPCLPDGHQRRGMSVVAALSDWLVHTNRRRSGSWMQRYERGVPVTGLIAVAQDDRTGTRVHFLPERQLRSEPVQADVLKEQLAGWSHLEVEFVREVPAS